MNMGLATLAETTVFIAANAANLLMAAIFLARAHAHPRLAKGVLGVALLLLGLPVGAAALSDWLNGGPWWSFGLPLPFLAFLALEWVLDYVRTTEFRHTWLAGPYLGLYYAAFMLMVGYSFLAAGELGFVTLLTYFAMLGSTAYNFALGGDSRHRPAGAASPPAGDA